MAAIRSQSRACAALDQSGSRSEHAARRRANRFRDARPCLDPSEQQKSFTIQARAIVRAVILMCKKVGKGGRTAVMSNPSKDGSIGAGRAMC